MFDLREYVVVEPDGSMTPFLLWRTRPVAYQFYKTLPTAEIKCIVDHLRGTCQEPPIELYRSCVAVLSYGGFAVESLVIPPLIGEPNVANEKAAAADALETLTLKGADDPKALPVWVLPLVIEIAKWAFDKWFRKKD